MRNFVSFFQESYSFFFSPTVLLPIILLCSLPVVLQGQDYDLLLKGGHVIDPANEIDSIMDVAVKDNRIARVATDISESSATRVIDVSGLYVTPGLIDLHSHHYSPGDPYNALPPDGFTFRSGVTTVVDVGGSGWKNFEDFKQQVIESSQTRVLAFLNIIGEGMRGDPYSQNMNDMDPKMTALVAGDNPEVVGIKIAHYRGHDWEPYRRAVQAAEEAGIPVMVDFGGAVPALPLKKLFFDVLRPGDIYSHAFGGGSQVPAVHGERQAVVDENGKLREGMIEAQKRGIIFDIGHGQASFFYNVAVPAFEQGLWPDVISTDLHRGSVNDGMKDMLNVVSKMMNMGMSLQEVIKASTWKPAQVIQQKGIGHLGEGAEADIAVFSLREGEFGFIDSRRFVIPGSEKLETELTLRAGRVVWDLNGLAARLWQR